MKKAVLGVLTIVALVLGGNYLSATRHAFAVTSDPANRGITVWAYHINLINPAGLVIDIRSIDGSSTSIADVMRVFFQIAAKFKDRQFTEVRLANSGSTRFLIRPERFRTIGAEHGMQNPVYVLRTLPEDILTPDGRPAYGQWTGGLLGVVGRQMEDLNDFARKWFIEPR